MKLIFVLALLVASAVSTAQGRFTDKECSINGFRNPSIGLEFRYRQVSLHSGYYVTNFTSNTTTGFVKAGVTYWFLPVDRKPMPSSFYAGVSYLYGLNRDFENESAVGIETGFRWFVWKGLNLRIGVIALKGTEESWKFNPTPGLSYSFQIK